MSDDKRCNIRLIGPVLETPYVIATWLVSYDPEAHDGRGHIEASARRERARIFADTNEAIRTYHAIPECHPVRESDGKPNRPLTAYTIEIIRVGVEP